MYSPKIDETLIPFLYRWAKRKGIPMTELVNRIIQDAIAQDDPDGVMDTL